ncbi:HD family phosphohydrolase [Fervidicella metallireducens AeB]|uniref:HD family phosphohydrolase n=1 Tax=Fervidicella metallireducens AeB TaxID=1403537 RepID=A0A017RRZ1_9CLOT|nr:HD domain-containing protein [Fervidicella metallireducens]EYE87229.1 HD family phosphohydrolase [Fervidicella metallireducens AeB]
MLYRVKQFFHGITAKLTSEDISFIDNFLDIKEKDLFFMLPEYEQAHSIRVARRVLEESVKREAYSDMLMKAALLHDIGKINSGLNLITKSIMVILNKLFPKYLYKLNGIKFVNAFYNHPELALGYLMDEEEEVKFLILNHHNYYIKCNEGLEILQLADSEN